jgi:hypothetical protein
MEIYFPSTPRLRGLIKIHKTISPIRPVNWKNAPAYKPAKMLVKLLQTHTPLPYSFNVKNTTQPINDNNLRLTSFDITNLYTNIPTRELLTIIDAACNNNYVEENLKHDIMKLSRIVINHNYFQFKDKTYLQHEGLAMGAPTSSIFSEFYVQFLEDSKIYNLLLNYNILGYFRYVEDTLILYNGSTTEIEDLLNDFNSLTANFKIHFRERSRLQN